MSEPKKKGKSQSQVLSQLGQNNIAELWTAQQDRVAYATVDMGGHNENLRLSSPELSQWLVRLYWELQNDAPGDRAIKNAIEYLSALAVHEGPSYRVYLRTARCCGTIYLDVGDTDWRCIEVTASGWRMISDPPVKFRRSNYVEAFPEPVRGGDLAVMRPVLSTDDSNWVKFQAAMLDALKGCGPYFVTVVTGEQGSAKTTACKIVRTIIDPLKAALLSSLPKEVRDLAANGNSEFALAYDNVSFISQWLSDCLCRIATGSGFKYRTLYTDGDLHCSDICAPILLNGIPDFAESSDLLSRSLLIYQPPILDNRLSEKEVWQLFEKAWPSAFGGLLDMLVKGLKDAETITLDQWNWLRFLEIRLAFQLLVKHPLGFSPLDQRFLHWKRHADRGRRGHQSVFDGLLDQGTGEGTESGSESGIVFLGCSNQAEITLADQIIEQETSPLKSTCNGHDQAKVSQHHAVSSRLVPVGDQGGQLTLLVA